MALEQDALPVQTFVSRNLGLGEWGMRGACVQGVPLSAEAGAPHLGCVAHSLCCSHARRHTHRQPTHQPTHPGDKAIAMEFVEVPCEVLFGDVERVGGAWGLSQRSTVNV